MSDDDSDANSDDEKTSRTSAKRKRRDSVSSSTSSSSKRHKHGHHSSSPSSLSFRKSKSRGKSEKTFKTAKSGASGKSKSKRSSPTHGKKPKSKSKSFRGGGNSKESKHSGGGSSSGKSGGKSKKSTSGHGKGNKDDDDDDLSVAEEEDDYELNDDFSMSRLGIPSFSAIFDNPVSVGQPLPYQHSPPPPLDTTSRNHSKRNGPDNGNAMQYDADTTMRETVDFTAGLDLPISTNTVLQQPASVLSWCAPANSSKSLDNPVTNANISIRDDTVDHDKIGTDKPSLDKSPPILANVQSTQTTQTIDPMKNSQAGVDVLSSKISSQQQVHQQQRQQQQPPQPHVPVCVQALATNTSTRMGQGGGGRSTDIVPTSIFSGNWPPPHPDDLRCFACERSDFIENLKKSDEATTLTKCYAAYGTMDDLELCKILSTYYDKTFRKYQPGQPRWTERGVLAHLSEHMFNVDAMLKVATRMCFRSVLDIGKNGMRVMDTSTGEIFCNAKGLGTFDKATKLLQSLAKANSK